MKLNNNYRNLVDNYLFAEVSARVVRYKAEHPTGRVISLGIGDVTRPLAKSVVAALKAAAEEMGNAATFKGYGPYEGYASLRRAIAAYYGERNVKLGEGEIFISDGAKNELGSILNLFDADNTVLICDPVYPVYTDTNLMDGRRIAYLSATAENGFLPMPDEKMPADLIYLCSPNNPTGAAYTKEQLKVWVDYANARGSVIL
ncbi:MAG: aminotransferase class I/II-fold pyridoxal phosphate-dependent enzyme, partial [Clostridiales bacterium]|nr:aminotransferase class I/II-fold pyridoxal phosphate-dependent enzyme [Clostridiales bacterium]